MEGNDFLELLNSAGETKTNLKEKFCLEYNPFPKSGISSINESDDKIKELIPLDASVKKEILGYITDVVSNTGSDSDNKYLSLLVLGDYGIGKTHTLMFIKYLFNSYKQSKSYVVYLDNPGAKLSELIGSVIQQVGLENFRRYLWSAFVSYMELPLSEDTSTTRKEKLLSDLFSLNESGMFNDQFINEKNQLWESASKISYKYLLDKLFPKVKAQQQKTIVAGFKEQLKNFFITTYQNANVADYFYDIVAENSNLAKSWTSLITGNIKDIDRREVNLLKAVVEIVKNSMGCDNFVILIDEFEEVAAGRLKESDLDNYLRNLRILIDREKNWCSVFAMNMQALENIRRVSPPLATRIEERKALLSPLDKECSMQIISNYLKQARSKDYTANPIAPFSEEAIETFLEEKGNLKGSPRYILKKCYELLQRAANLLEKDGVIDRHFVEAEIS